MKAADVMTTDVVTVSKDATVRDVARTMLQAGISAVPVVDAAGKLAGIVSEGDLMRRAELKTERQHPWWLELLTGDARLATDFTKTHARKVADIMTRKVVTASPSTPLAEIADLLEAGHIKRVPIVSRDKIVGIVSRANLLQALATLGEETVAKDSRKAKESDAAIRKKVLDRINAEPWRPWLLNVTVSKGAVDLWGIADSRAEKEAARVAAEGVPGVVEVRNNLLVRPKNWWDAAHHRTLLEGAGPQAAPKSKPARAKSGAS